jgi:activator of HSP90 ATPase
VVSLPCRDFQLTVQFDVNISSETSSKEVLRPLIRSKLVPQLRQRLSKFSSALIEEHGKDVYNPSLNVTPATSGSGTPTVVSKPSTPAPASQPTHSKISTSELTEDVEFTATAQDLYDCFVDPEKLTRWTRNQVNVDPRVGGQFVLFQGHIEGKFLVLQSGKEIQQTWRLSTWPEGRPHNSRRFD